MDSIETSIMLELAARMASASAARLEMATKRSRMAEQVAASRSKQNRQDSSWIRNAPSVIICSNLKKLILIK